jgi:hypothetical protein
MRSVRISLAVSLVLMLLLALVPGAMAHSEYRGHEWMKSHDIECIDIVKTITGTSGDHMTFKVPAMAVKGKEGKVATFTFPTPLEGSYNTSTDMGYISTRNAKTSDIAIRPFANATLNVAGASAVMSMRGIKVLLKEDDLFVFEFHKIGMYLPDGKGMEYKLEKPVKVIYSKDRKTLVIDAYPGLTSSMSGAFTGATFPADAQPVLVKDIAIAEMSGESMWAGHMRPTATATPMPTYTATPTAMPTYTATPMPTAMPTTTP